METEGEQVPSMIDRLHVARTKPRDKKREVTVPEGVLGRRGRFILFNIVHERYIFIIICR